MFRKDISELFCSTMLAGFGIKMKNQEDGITVTAEVFGFRRLEWEF